MARAFSSRSSRAGAISALVASAALATSSSCVLPQHRTIATVVNGAVGGVGAAGLIFAAAAGDSGFIDLRPEIAGISGGLVVQAVVGELLTYWLHHPESRRTSPAPPASAPRGGCTPLQSSALRFAPSRTPQDQGATLDYPGKR